MPSSIMEVDAAQDTNHSLSIFDKLQEYLHEYMASDQCRAIDRIRVKNIAQVLQVFGRAIENSPSLDITFNNFMGGMNISRSQSIKRDGNEASCSLGATNTSEKEEDNDDKPLTNPDNMLAVYQEEQDAYAHRPIVEDAPQTVKREDNDDLPPPLNSVYGPYPPYAPKYEHKPHPVDGRGRPRDPTPPPPEIPVFIHKYVRYPGGKAAWLPDYLANTEIKKIEAARTQAREDKMPIAEMTPPNRRPYSETFLVVNTLQGAWCMHPTDGYAYRSALTEWASATNARRERDGITERVDGDHNAKITALKRKSMEQEQEAADESDGPRPVKRIRGTKPATPTTYASSLSRASGSSSKSRLSTRTTSPSPSSRQSNKFIKTPTPASASSAERVATPGPSPLRMSSKSTRGAVTPTERVRHSPRFPKDSEEAQAPFTSTRVLQRSFTMSSWSL